MTHKHFLTLFLILTLTTLACGLAAPASPSPTPAPVQVTVSALTDLSAGQMQNAQYQLGARDDHTVVQLTDGKYQQGTDATTMDFAYAGITEFISVGDLTGDGVTEIAAIFFENYGGTGNFGFLTIYTNVNGQPVFLTSTMIDDRPLINSMSIENGEIYLDAVIHGFEDGGCCPTLQTTQRYALVNNKLRLMNYTTVNPEAKIRNIEIMSPADQTQVSEFAQINGAVSIAPFENNLSYFIYDEAGNQLASGPVTVTAPDFGAPGTFSELIPLAGIPVNTIIYLEIQDISAADGFIQALDVVKLIVK